MRGSLPRAGSPAPVTHRGPAERKGGDILITVRINGQEESFTAALSVSAFLEAKGYRTDRVAVEKNGAIVLRREYEGCLINDRDTLEVVSFVGGG